MQQMDHANTNCTITLAPAQLWELFTGGHAFSDVPRALLGHKVGAALSGGSAHCRSQLAAQAAGKRTAAHLGQHTSNSTSLPPPGPQVAVQGLRPRFPGFAPREFRQLAEQCWHADPEKRCDPLQHTPGALPAVYLVSCALLLAAGAS